VAELDLVAALPCERREDVCDISWSFRSALGDTGNLYDRRSSGLRIYSLAVVKTLVPQMTSDLISCFQQRHSLAHIKGLLNYKCGTDEAKIETHLSYCKVFVDEVLQIQPFPAEDFHKACDNVSILLSPHDRSMEELRAAKDQELALFVKNSCRADSKLYMVEPPVTQISNE